MTDPLLAEIDAYRTQQRDRQARTSLLVAGSVPPVRAAQAERDAQVLGIPSQSVLADPRFSREAQVERDATLLASAPKTATWITDDNNAAVAHDQVGSLTGLEALLQRTLQIGKNLRGSLWANIPQTSAGIVGSIGALSDISDAVLGAPFRAVESLLGTSTYSDNIAAESGRRDNYRQYLMQASAASTPKVDNVYEQAAYSGISSILPSLAGVGVGIATRSPAAGAAFMAVPVGGASYGQARDKGQGVVPSLAYGTAHGGAEFIGDKIGLGPLLDGLKMGSPFLKTFFKTQVAEQLGEQATTVLQDFTDYAMMNEGQTFGDYLRARPNAAVQTAIATAVGSGATTSLSYGAQAGARRLDAYAQERLLAAEAPAKAAHFDEVVDAVKTQELLVRSPERFKTFLNDVTGGNAVYVSGEAAATFFQSNPELDQWLDEWDIRDQVEQAAIAGTDVAIPADVYLSQVAQTQAHEAWHDDLKFEPNGMTLRTAMEREASGEQDLIDAFGEAANDVDQQLNAIEPYERVRSDVFDKLTRAGRPPAEARLGAIILAERYTTRSERMNEQYPDAWAAYQAQGGVEFRREATPSVQRTADRLDLVLKVVQEGDGQTQRQLRGDSLLEFISKSGGITDAGGDLAALDVAAWSNPRVSGVPGRKRIIRRPDAEPGAYGLDDALTRAKEAGYLRDDATVEDLTEAMRGELSGRQTYSADVIRNNRVDETLQAAADLEEMLTTAGIDPSTATIEQVRALVDQAGEVGAEGYDQSGQLVTDSEAFRAWFGDSKVVDENGAPLVVYHGGSADIDAFATEGRGKTSGAGAFFSSDPMIASTYAPSRTGGNVAPVYVSLQRPMVVDVGGANWSRIGAGVKISLPETTVDRSEDNALLEELGVEPGPATRSVPAREVTVGELFDDMFDDDVVTTDDLSRWARQNGYDGVIFRQAMDRGPNGYALGLGEAKPSDIFVAFAPTQIKSTMNRGTFDPADPRILYQTDTPFTGPRGQINPSDADASIITFFKAADASTFIHEMVGHQFLEELMTDAALDGASEQLRADVATVGEWFANYGGAKALDEVRGSAEAAAKRAAKKPGDAALARQVQRLNDALAYADEQGGASFMVEVGRTLGANVPAAHRSVLMTPYHEVFARGAERYLMEGKSPSVELRGAFSRFADWIKKLYKAVDNLNAPISKPVRDVMSRLLATDAQIDAVRQAQGLNRIFADPKAGGMNKPEYDAYTKKDQAALEAARARAYEKAMAPIRRQLMETMKAEREELRAEQSAAVDAQPDIAALALIADSGVKLNRQGLIDLAGSDAILKLLPNKRPAIYAKDGGLYPDDLAQRVGLTSGDQLLDALVAHEKERQARVAQGDRRPIRDARIEDALDAMMNFLHGDPVNDGTLDELVTAAMHDKQKADVLVEEANGLAKLANREALWTREGITAYAKETIDGMVAAKLRPDAYLRAERSAGLKVQRALLKGNHSAALDAKLLQAVNFELYRQAREAGEAFAKGETLFNKIVRAKDDKTAKARNFDMVNAAREILAAYGLTRSRGQTPASYLALVQAYDADAYAALKPSLDAAVEDAAPLDTLTVEQVSELISTVEALWSQSRESQVMEIDGRRFELATARQKIAGDLSAQGPRPSKPKNRAQTKKERVGTDLLSVRSLLGKVEEWAMRQGPAFTKYIWNPISEGAEAYRTLQREKMPKLQKALETLRPDIVKPFKIEGTEIGYTFGFDGGNGIVELIGAMRHLGNPSNYRKLLLGREWATLNEDGTLNDSAFRAMMDRLHREGVIQKRHWDYVQAEWDLHDEIKPFVQKAHRKMTGRYFEEVTSAPVETPFGTYKGGYVPAKADPNLVKRQREFDAQAQAEGGVRGQALMFPDGSTKARTDVNRALDLDLRKALSQFDETMRYAMIGPAVQDVSRLLKETQFAELLNDYDDGVWNDFLQPWLIRSLAQRTTTPSSHPGIRMAENVMSVVVRRTGASIMFANVVNAAQQLTGFSPALLRTGKRNMASALRTYLTDPVGTYERVAELSPMMANRFSTQVRDVAMEAERIVMAPGPYGKAVQWSEANTYFLQRGVQNFMDPIVWTAAYDRAVQRKEENPVAYADMVVRTTQDSYAPEGASAFSGGPKWAAPFKMFTGYFIGQVNLIATEGKRAWQEKDIARMGEIYALAVFIPAVGAEIISQAIRGTLGDEDEDGWVDDLMDIFLISQLRYVAAFIPILGPGVMSAFNAFDDNPMNDRLSLSPVVSTVEAPARVIANLRKYADGKGDASRMVKDVGTLVSAGTGFPTLPRQTSYVADVLEGDVNPTGPVDAARGFVSGAASEASKEN